MLPEGIRPVWLWVDTYDETKAETYTGLTDPETGAVLNAEVSMNILALRVVMLIRRKTSTRILKGTQWGLLML